MKKALGRANNIVRVGNRIVMDLDDDGNDYAYIEQVDRREVVVSRERRSLRT